MYNFRILIQEIQLLRGSFRIYVVIAHGSTCLGTPTTTTWSGWWGQSTRATSMGHSRPHLVLIISLGPGGCFITGQDLVQKPDMTFLYQASFPSRNLICWRTLKKRARRSSGRMVITSWLVAWGSKALEDGRLNNIHCQREIQEKW